MLEKILSGLDDAFFSKRQVWVLVWEILIMCASYQARGLAAATAETDIETRRHYNLMGC